MRFSVCSVTCEFISFSCRLSESASKFLPKALAAQSFASLWLASSSWSDEPNFVMSAARERVSLMSANLWPGPMSAARETSSSSASADAFRCASCSSVAILSSSRTAKPFEAYKFLRLSLTRALTRSCSATDLRKATRSCSVRISSSTSIFLSYRWQSQTRMSATSSKCGTLKFSIEMRRG